MVGLFELYSTDNHNNSMVSGANEKRGRCNIQQCVYCEDTIGMLKSDTINYNIRKLLSFMGAMYFCFSMKCSSSVWPA